MSPGVLTLAMLGENTGGNATDVFLTDAVVVDLGPQAGHGEDVDVPQIGETGQAVFQPLLRASAGQTHQGHLPHPAALVCCQLELSLGTHFGQREHLGRQEELGSGENRNLQSLEGHLPLGFTTLEQAQECPQNLTGHLQSLYDEDIQRGHGTSYVPSLPVGH